MQRITFNVGCLLGVVCLFTTAGCTNSVSGHFCDTVFATFTYIGTDEAADLSLNKEAEIPTALAAGVTYIFLLPRASEEIGQWTTFTKRLREAGATVLREPKSGGDLASITVGGPLFTIAFQYKGHRGSISNEIEPRVRSSEPLSSKWMLERYVLRLDD